MKPKNATREKLLDITFDEIYKNGYSATAIGTILKLANVPKGSMYHHFDSKKSLVIAMIKERLYPKMDTFFSYKKQENRNVFRSFEQTFIVMSKHKNMVTYGCPLHRLMVELSAVDETFDTLLLSKYQDMLSGVESLLQVGIDDKEFQTTLDPKSFAKFFVASTWGALSLSPTVSSSKEFYAHTKFIMSLLAQYKRE